jgi:hypothetical protein
MASTYVNDLRLNEMATGDASGTWGTTTNTNLELISEKFGYGTEALSDASTATITMADGAADGFRSLFLKLTGSLSQACTVTLAPNTLSNVWVIDNAAGDSVVLTQGTGANVTIPSGEVKIVATDGAGAGAVVYDVLTDTNLAGTTKTAALTNAGALSNQGTLTVGVDDTGYDVKFFGATAGKYMLWDESADSVLVNGDIDMVTNGNRIDLDTDNDTSIRASADDTITVEIGGSDLIALTSTSTFSCPLTVGVNDTGHDVNFFGATAGQKVFWDESADTLYQTCTVDIDGTVTVGVDDTGYDVKFFGATASAYMLWDESADDLILAGAARVVVPASGLVIGSTAVTSTAAEINTLDALDRGSIIYGNASSVTTVLGQGSADQVLTSDGTDISWEDAGGGVSGLTGLVENDSIWLGNDPSGTTSTASYSIGLGTTALDAITTGDNNTAIGYGALGAQTVGHSNTCVGMDAGAALVGTGDPGSMNTIIGQDAGKAAVTSQRCTWIGKGVMTSAENPTHQTFVGMYAGSANYGNYSVAIGSSCLTNGAGAENVGIGRDHSSGGGGNNVTGSIYIGNSITATADTRVNIGNSSSYIYADFNSASTWTHSSDERMKKDIQTDTLGLSFINDLRPVTYKYKAPSEYPKEWLSYSPPTYTKEPTEEGGEGEIVTQKTEPMSPRTDHGLIAQEVKAALDKAGVSTFAGWGELEDGKQTISREMFVIPLINAIQELSAKVAKLENKEK